MFELLGWIGSITGPMGALLLALNIRVSRFGYVLFLVSSLTMTVYAIDGGDSQVLVQNILFSIINSVGLYRWVLRPAWLSSKGLVDAYLD